MASSSSASALGPAAAAPAAAPAPAPAAPPPPAGGELRLPEPDVLMDVEDTAHSHFPVVQRWDLPPQRELVAHPSLSDIPEEAAGAPTLDALPLDTSPLLPAQPGAAAAAAGEPAGAEPPAGAEETKCACAHQRS
jgi:hypothetical protein